MKQNEGSMELRRKRRKAPTSPTTDEKTEVQRNNFTLGNSHGSEIKPRLPMSHTLKAPH